MVTEMIEQTAHIEIDAAPADVYAVAGALDWFGPETAVKRLDSGDGLGGSYELRTHALGTVFVFTVEVDAEGEPNELAFRSVDGKECSFEGEYLIEPTGAGSQVTLRVRAKPHGRYRLMKPVLAPLLHHGMHDTLARLRGRAEARPAKAA